MPITINVGHSPDPDDAFMFHALANDKIPTGNYRFTHTLQDIETLNHRSQRGELELTAVSLHGYAYVTDKYALCACGASIGDNYGPMVVARQPMSIGDLRGKKIAVPGTLTTAFLALKLLLGDTFTFEVHPFDEILNIVEAGKADAGLIIHEGQLTFQNQGLHLVVDLGRWWHDDTGLPLPLGGNAIRKDLGQQGMEEVTALLKQSIQYGLEHRAEALAHAAAIRPRPRPQPSRQIRRHVRQRLDARLRPTRPRGGFAVAPPSLRSTHHPEAGRVGVHWLTDIGTTPTIAAPKVDSCHRVIICNLSSASTV